MFVHSPRKLGRDRRGSPHPFPSATPGRMLTNALESSQAAYESNQCHIGHDIPELYPLIIMLADTWWKQNETPCLSYARI